MKLNEKLIKLRKEKGLSQEEFGNEINVSRQAISKWEASTTKPDIEKLKEIANYFDVSYDYLLNDEIDNIEDAPKKSEPKKKKHIFLKILLVILIIYLLICVYKFIVLFRFYKIADSFSESKYSISISYNSPSDPFGYNGSTEKIHNQLLNTSYNDPLYENALRDENGNLLSYHIEFYDYDKKIAYTLVYDEETQKYFYSNNISNFQTEEDWQRLFATGQIIKDYTFSCIPNSFKNILLASINPIYQVSLKDRIIYTNFFNRTKTRAMLTNDCLISNYDLITEFDGSMEANYSYDYVQDHFPDYIEDPVITYKDKISNYSEIEHIK